MPKDESEVANIRFYLINSTAGPTREKEKVTTKLQKMLTP
jgi:hypothetical protein